MTRKTGHIWRIWVEMTQTLMPKSTKVAQIHLPERSSARIRQISAKIRQNLPNVRQNAPISQILFHKRALTLNTQGFLYAPKKANLSFKSLFPKPHLNRTGSVFALPILVAPSTG